LRQVGRPDEVVRHGPSACAGCGASLAGTPVAATEARQVFDLPRIVLRVFRVKISGRGLIVAL
jgi:hypothetical protein